MGTTPTIGVLALQGDVREHRAALDAAGARTIALRRASELDSVDGVVIPGGESTTMSRLLQVFDLLEPLRARLRERRIDVQLSDAAYALLMKEGFDPAFGAREMERAVDRLVAQPLGKLLLEGRLAEGSIVGVEARDGELVLEDRGETRRLDRGR